MQRSETLYIYWSTQTYIYIYIYMQRSETFPRTKPSIGLGWLSVILENVILVFEQSLTQQLSDKVFCNNILGPLIS